MHVTRAQLVPLTLGLGALAWVARALAVGEELTPIHYALAITALSAPLSLRFRPLALVGGLAAVLAVGWSYDAVPAPYVDTVRPWGMDWEPYPLLRPTFGTMLLLGLAPAAFFAASRLGRVALRILTVALCGGLLAFWLTPRWYEMDLVANEGIVPDMPEYLPHPGRVGPGDTPVVIGGELHQLHWSQYAYRRTPAEALWFVAHRELAVAGITHGMHWSLSDAQVASGQLDPATAASRAHARSVLWELARGGSTAWIYSQAAGVLVWVWTILRSLRAPGPREAWVHRQALRLLGLGGPAINLVLLLGMLVTRLPEAWSVAPRIFLESTAWILAGLTLERVAREAPRAA